MDIHSYKTQLASIQSEADFNQLALSVFEFQLQNCTVYRNWCESLNVNTSAIKHLHQIPFLPIRFFKSHAVIAEPTDIFDKTFSSSGTTGSLTSSHFVKDVSLYEWSFNSAFERYYGNIEEWTILALLPSYLERTGSSLIYMAERLINDSKCPLSGFYLNEWEKLNQAIKDSKVLGKKTLLLGVSFALIDMIDAGYGNHSDIIVMETGGMKGRRKELVREDLHSILKEGFGVAKIHSEYGMTELLSQAYSKGDGIFTTPPWMKMLLRDSSDPLQLEENKSHGGLNIIDLANLYSCAFIATDDLARKSADNSFEILGRFDQSDIRGCNLLIQ